MSALDISEYVTDEADGRGRLNVGLERAGSVVTYVILDSDTLSRLDGPSTKRVQSDGRLSIGSEFAHDEVTAGIIQTNE